MNIKRVLLTIVLATSAAGSSVAQDETAPNRNLPPQFSDYKAVGDTIDGSSIIPTPDKISGSQSLSEPKVKSESELMSERLEYLQRVAAEAASAAEAYQLKVDNISLKLSLQQLQIDRASAYLQLERLRKRSSESEHEEAAIIWQALWTGDGNGVDIPVYWENPSPSNLQERLAVQQAVESTWGANSGLRFTEWTALSPGTQGGIRIRIADEGAHCKQLGRFLDGYPAGMVLNFTFRNWCPGCGGDRMGSIRKIAVHEFGHAIGFAHEQNRNDAPLWCQNERQGSNPNWYVTIYDPSSIMNYCNPAWNNNGFLSSLDIQAVQALYGVPGSRSQPQAAQNGESPKKKKTYKAEGKEDVAVPASKK